MTYAIQCKASGLYFSETSPGQGALKLSLVAWNAAKYRNETEASAIARALRSMFGSFDWQPVQVFK